MAVSFPVYQPPDISGAFAQGQQDATRAAAAPLTLANMLEEDKLTKLKVSQEEQLQSDQRGIRKILQGADYSSPEGLAKAAGDLSRGGYGNEAMGMLRFGQQYAGGQYQQQIKQIELSSKHQDTLAGELDVIRGQVEAMKARGAKPDELDAATSALVKNAMPRIIQDHPEIADHVRQAARNPAIFTYAGLVAAEERTNWGQERLKTHLEQLRLGVQAGTEAERERHDRAMEDIGEARANRPTGMGGAMNARFANRVLGASNEGEAAVSSVAKMGSSKSIFSNSSTLSVLSPQETRRYNAAISGLSVEIAYAQNGGMAPNEPQIDEIKNAITIQATDDPTTSRYRIALAARYLRKGLESSTTLMNPAQQAKAQELLGKLSRFPDPDSLAGEGKGGGYFPGATGTSAAPAPRQGPTGASFSSQADLQSAIAAGRVKKGDRVTVAGQSGTIQ